MVVSSFSTTFTGQTLDVHLMPEEAYGLADPDAIFTVELAQLPGAEELEAGQQVYLQNAAGQPFPVKVVEKDETTSVCPTSMLATAASNPLIIIPAPHTNSNGSPLS